MKKNSTHKIYIWKYPLHQYWRLGKKRQLFTKNIYILSNIWHLLYKLQKIKRSIQVFVSALEKHYYIKLAFETNVNNN
jgi:hypothetical protein